MKTIPRVLKKSVRRAARPTAETARRSIDTWLPLAMGLGSSPSSATPATVHTIAAAYACINVLSSDIASLPMHVFERDGDTRRAADAPESRLFAVSPDGETTPYLQRQAALGHVFTRGNAYLEIQRSSSGTPSGLLLADPDSIQAARDRSGRLWYVPSSGIALAPANVIHLAGYGFDGLSGHSPVSLLRRTFGLGIDQESYASTYFANSATPRGVLETDKVMTAEAAKRLANEWESHHAGIQQAHRVGVLYDGLKYKPISISPEDSQFLQQRQFTVEEIARIYRVPPFLIQDFRAASLNNMDAAYRIYWETTITPIAEMIEQAFNLKLYPDGKRFVELNLTARLRGNPSERSAYYHAALGDGWLTRDEVRRRENLDPIGPARGGDVLTVQVNQTTLESMANGSPTV